MAILLIQKIEQRKNCNEYTVDVVETSGGEYSTETYKISVEHIYDDVQPDSDVVKSIIEERIRAIRSQPTRLDVGDIWKADV